MNILTFDLEDWFHCDFITGDLDWDRYPVRIHEGVDRILDVLEKEQIKATFFCLGWIVAKYPDVVRRIQASGHQLGCHSDMHELVFRFDRKAFEQDTERAIKRLEDVTGIRINLYRAPAFSITEKSSWAFEVLAKLGIEIDCSIFPSLHDYGGFSSFGKSEPAILDISGYRMKEYPINSLRVFGKDIIFSGGGYFRLFPYVLIHHWMKQSNYVMTYFHIRDFDPHQPMLPQLPIHRKFKSYVGLKSAFRKFEQLITDFKFITVEQADKVTDWSTAKIIKIV